MTTAFDGVGTAVIDGFTGMPAQLLLVIPAGLTVAAVRWGAPVAVAFFKRIAK